MNTLLKYREKEYFKENPNDYYLFQIIAPCVLKIAKLLLHNNAYYFNYNGIQIKSITTPSISLSELKGTYIHYKNHPIIKGRIGSFGITNSPFIYVIWTNTPMFDEKGNHLGMPCALPDNYNLELII